MKKSAMTAVKLRIILIVGIIGVTVGAVGAFYYAQSVLRSYANEVSVVNAEAEASRNNVQVLQQLSDSLGSNQEIVDRTSRIVAESQSYQYQNEIIYDLTQYANAAGIGITGFTFQTTTPGATTPAAPATTPGAIARPVPAGLKSVTATIALATPVEYVNLLRFVRSIEQNLTKMQLQSISLSRGESSTTVSTDSLNVEVYVR